MSLAEALAYASPYQIEVLVDFHTICILGPGVRIDVERWPDLPLAVKGLADKMKECSA